MQNYVVNWWITMKYTKVAQDWIIFTGITCVNCIQFRWKYTHSNKSLMIFNFDSDVFLDKMHNYVVNWWYTMTYMSRRTELYLQISSIRITSNMEWNSDLIEKCRLKRSKSLIYELIFSIIAQAADKIQRNYISAYISKWFTLTYYKTFTFWSVINNITWMRY